MSICLHHTRRALMGASTRRAPSSSSAIASTRALPSISLGIANTANHFPTRHFAAAAAKPKKKKKTQADDPNAGLSYNERKAAAKQLRRDTYERKQARLERLKIRRDDSPKDVKKTLFRSWWDKELMYHDVLRRNAKKEGKPWRIRVAAMVERLPVVTPDTPQWERDYIDLRDYILTWGKVYPDETGFMFAEEKDEDHIVPTDEELIAGLPFTPAPRETEADASGEIHTRDRQLKERVYLALKTDAEGNKSGPRWTLPSAIPQTDETLLQTAERAVSESVGADLGLWCPSNAPMAVNFRVYNQNLPEEFRENYYGEKIYYYRVQWDRGDVDESAVKKNAEDWGWLTRGEITERVEEERGKHQAKFFHYML